MSRISVICQYIRHARPAFGNGRRLVEQNRAHVLRSLQRFGILVQDAHRRGPPRRRHDGYGRRQPERAGARDHQHADRHTQNLRHRHRRGARSPQDHPHRKGQRGNAEDDGHKDARDLVDRLFDRRFGRARLAHHLYDTGKDGVFPHLFGTDAQHVALIDRSAGDEVTLADFHGQALARYGRFIDKRIARKDDAVHRDTVPLLHDDDVTLYDLGKADSLLRPVPLHVYRVGCKFQKFFDLFSRPALGAGLQPLPQRYEREHHRRRFKEQIIHGKFMRVRIGHDEHDDDAVQVRHGRTETDEGIHVRHAFEERLYAAPEKGEIDKQDGRRQQQLQKGEILRAFMHIPKKRQRGARHMMQHRQIHQRNEKPERDKKAHFQFFCLVAEAVRLPFFFGRALCAPVRNGCAVTQPFDGGDDLPLVHDGFVVIDDHALAHEADFRLSHAVHPADRLLYPRRTGGTGHSHN